MRKTFSAWASDRIDDEHMWLLTPDVGYGILNKFIGHPRFVNTGLSEELTMNMAIGLALSGKNVYIYSIATFLIYGAYEQIRNYVVRLNLPITIIGCGKDMTYKSLDHSHWAIDDTDALKAIGFKHIVTPNDTTEFVYVLDRTMAGEPWYVRIA